jgi:hypothetical protein
VGDKRGEAEKMKKRPKTMWMIVQAAILAALLLAVLWSGNNTVSVSAVMSIIIAVLFWVDYFTVVTLTVAQALGTTLFVMVLSMNVFRWYFSGKGGVE